MARKSAEGQRFYVNITKNRLEIPLEESAYGVLTEKDYSETLVLEGYGLELLVRGG